MFLAGLGALLPVLPTTPFLLLAFWLFARSSPRLARWLLTNRIFGEYLENYRSGRGIALRIKIFVISLMWLSIGYCILVLIDGILLQAMLMLVAVCVTFHIASFKTLKRDTKEFLVLFATEAEVERFNCSKTPNVAVELVGVGSSLAAVNTLCFVKQYNPRVVILAGIAGAFTSAENPLEIGQSVVVTSEYNGDLGSFSSGSFEPKFAQKLECSLYGVQAAIKHLPTASSLCVNAAASPFVSRKGFDIENMEGWGFFKACQNFKIEYLELRTISNFVGDPFEKWEVDLALENLTAQLNNIISKL